MPNIALTTYCNLHCPYCFANDMITTEKIKNISLEQFNKTLKWIDEPEHIGLIGGEPTLHPQFKEIVKIVDKYCDKNPEAHFVLYTNGVYLDDYIQYFPNHLDILINVNQPQAMTEEQFNRMHNNINTFAKLGWLNTQNNIGRVTIGCNICEEIDDYSFFFNIVKEFGIKEVRTSVTAPTKEKDRRNKFNYYIKMKPKYLKFVEDAKINHVLLNKDCNQIPECFFTKEELAKIDRQLVENFEGFHCDPVIDITPDFHASSCFGAYELMDCSEFQSSSQLRRYAMYKKMYPKVEANGHGMCEGCPKHEKLICQGGCLSFAPKRVGETK